MAATLTPKTPSALSLFLQGAPMASQRSWALQNTAVENQAARQQCHAILGGDVSRVITHEVVAKISRPLFRGWRTPSVPMAFRMPSIRSCNAESEVFAPELTRIYAPLSCMSLPTEGRRLPEGLISGAIRAGVKSVSLT